MDRVKQEQRVLKVRLINRSIESQIAQNYRKTARRIIFLDYDGTLVPFSRYPEMAVPDERVLAQVKRLAADAKNTLVIVSGRKQRVPGPVVRRLCRLSWSPNMGPSSACLLPAWTSEVDADPAWKQQVLPVLQRYADRCTGAFIEEKSLSLVWHYRNADPGDRVVAVPGAQG